jgi:hypothetical protein
LPDWALVLLGYSILWWIALEVQSLYSVGPELLVVAGFCLVMAMLLRLEPGARLVQFMMALATAQYIIRVVNHSIPVGEAPSSTEEDLIVAERLRDTGMTPGTKVAVIGDGEGACWARLAHVRIVAEIMDRNGGSVQFWRAPESVQQHVYDLFQSAHAKLAVASCGSSCPARPKGWKEIPVTSYCVYNLDAQGSSSNHLP